MTKRHRIASPILLAIEHKWPGEDIVGVKSIAARDASSTAGVRTRRVTVDTD